jgi:cell division protein FtsB
MKKIILTASWFAVAVYCILTGVYGPSGLKATAQAEEAVAAMHKNINSLEKLNAEYAMEWNALRSDAGLTAVQGRSLGFIASDEVVVRVALPAATITPAFIGERVLFMPGRSLSATSIRMATIFTWLFLLFSGLALKLFWSWRHPEVQGLRRNRFQREIRDQDASRT